MWDYIIIGAGSGGCAASYQLALSGEHKVLLLEAGGSDKSPYIKIPAGVGEAAKKHDWHYRSQPDPSRNGKSEDWTRGRVLGGSSSINGTIYVRGAAHDFDHWASLGNEGWAYSDLLPLFKAMESCDQRNNTRGQQGPLKVRTVQALHPLTDLFLKTAVTAGQNLNPDYNSGSQEGVGIAQMTQKKGFRHSAADAFIRPLKGQKNFECRLHTTVHKITCEQGRATGVVCETNNTVITETARHVIVCAGAINTPQLLMLSGIGDQETLAKLGIDCVLNKPEVGKNLREHPLIRCVYKTKIPSHNLTEGLLQKFNIALQYVLRRQGPIANIFEAAAFLKTQPQLIKPDVQLHFLAMGIDTSNKDNDFFLNEPSLTIYINKSYPQSKGQIRLVSSDPTVAPSIECRLLDTDTDIDTLVNGVKLVRQIMAHAPMNAYIEAEILPGSDYKQTESLKNYVQDHTEIGYHPIGTCRMGADENAVVDAHLNVKGIDNLWIGDASIMPTPISGNTNAICMLIGMKLGKQLAAR